MAPKATSHFGEKDECRKDGESWKKNAEEKKWTNLGMASKATLISHFGRRTSVEGAKTVRKQNMKRPYT